jgi:rod shape-determining protein MreC
MFKYLKEYRFYIILSLFILIPIIAIDTSTRAPRDYRWHDRAIVRLTSPIQSAISWSLDFTVSVFQNYIFLFHTRKENLTLVEENRRLLNTIVNLQETLLENERLRKLLSFKEEFQVNSVVARVIARDVSTEFRMIRINRGEDAGIRPNMAVVNSEGIVGRIYRTTKHSAEAVTILDLLSAVDAIVERSRARGIVEGMTDEVCQLRFALRTDDIQPGDRLISSGLGGIFPKGVPVGTVSRVFKKPFGITQTVEVVPSVDFSRLEEVMVITSFNGTPIHASMQGNAPLPHLLPKAEKEKHP